ncbi:hypothetical protein BJX70DRAFT_410666 [Aspergillus crustosus]
MDPFSLLAGAAGVIDVTVKLINYLSDTEIQSLLNVNLAVQALCNARSDRPDTGTPAHNTTSSDLATEVDKALASLLEQTKPMIESLHRLLQKIIGKPGAGIRQRLTMNQNMMQINLLALVIVPAIAKTGKAQQTGISQLSDDQLQQVTELQSKTARLRQEARGLEDSDVINRSLASVAEVVSCIRLNEIFETPQKESRALASVLNVAHSRERQTHQKRFVIFGLGGSGKTQFCCKFAEDNRDQYWGIFWIDGSSREKAKHSFSRIAKSNGLESTETAAKNWLSSSRLPWLLLINKADSTDVDVLDLCPSGERGVILITTRNPSNKRHGTEGPCSFRFDKLGNQEATELVLATAVIKPPWEDRTRKYADQIARILGYLPLALVHAGMAILDQLCSLSDCPDYFERTWSRIRGLRTRGMSAAQMAEVLSNMSVYTSYEMIYLNLESKDDRQSTEAVDLLGVCSFLYSDCINFEMLKAAAVNPRREREASRLVERTARLSRVHATPQTWGAFVRQWIIAVAASLNGSPSYPPILPEVLRDLDETPFDEDRLRSALSLLVKLGLLSVNGKLSYGMHTTAEQAVWCQAGATVLAQTIFLRAPAGYAAQDEDLKRMIYPHVETVRRRAAIEYAKFSLVYLYMGQWSEAEELQNRVKDIIFATLAYSIQSLKKKARTLQYEVLASAKRLYGPAHPRTLQIMDTLGATCLDCSRLREAQELHEEAVAGLTALRRSGIGFDPEHEHEQENEDEHTLMAMHNLSKVRLRYFDFDDGFDIALVAYNGLSKLLGTRHQKTLDAQLDLATLYGFKGPQHHPQALRMAEAVTRIRASSLGREHPLTLVSRLAVVNFKTAMGQFVEAEQMMKEGLQAAERSLGKTHLGTLLGWNFLGHVYWRWGRYEEAAGIWEDVTKVGHYEEVERAEGEHFDRVQAMWFLVHCREDQGRIGDALGLCEELVVLIRDFGGEGLGPQHKLWGHVNEKKDELKLKTQEKDRSGSGNGNGTPTWTVVGIPPKKVIKGFTF